MSPYQFLAAVTSMTRRQFMRSGGAAIGGALLLACGKQGVPDEPTPVREDVSVTIAVRADDKTHAALEKALPAVRYGLAPGGRSGMPNIREIQRVVSTPGRSFVAAIRQRVAAGEAPDVVWFGLHDDLPEIVRGDLLRPLNPFLDNDSDNTLKGYHPESLTRAAVLGAADGAPGSAWHSDRSVRH